MTAPIERDDRLARTTDELFQQMVDSTGIKRFSANLGLSTRQINRILSGAQPNPIERVVRCIQCCDPEAGDHIVDFICQEAGGYFVREEAIEAAAVNAVKECAEAIAAISDGVITTLDEIEIREAVQALMSLARAVRDHRQRGIEHPMVK